MKFQRTSRVSWQVTSGNRWFTFSTIRHMVPVDQVRNPLAGDRSWFLRVGKFRVEWY